MKKIFISVLLSFTALTNVSPIYAQEIQSASAEVEPRADQYVWHYKIENGKRYKRLWNETKSRWETDWILVP